MTGYIKAEGTISSYDNVGIVLDEDTGVKKIIPYTAIESIRESMC